VLTFLDINLISFINLIGFAMSKVSNFWQMPEHRFT